MPPKPLSATLVLCEKVLQEADGIVSAIRFVDLFYIPPSIDPEAHAVLLTILVACKFSPDDESKHSLKLTLKRPDGSEKNVEFPERLEVSLGDLTPKIPGNPRGFNVIAPWGVKATHMGVHLVTLFVDDCEVTRATFTLAPQPAPKNE